MTPLTFSTTTKKEKKIIYFFYPYYILYTSTLKASSVFINTLSVTQYGAVIVHTHTPTRSYFFSIQNAINAPSTVTYSFQFNISSPVVLHLTLER